MNRIRDLRKERNMTQAELAGFLMVSDRSVGFYETGERDPDTDTLRKLADYFGVSIDYLLGRSEIRETADKLTYLSKESNPSMIKESDNEAELPPEAKEEIDKFKEYIRHKYRKK
ncbi:MAG: helix-turn-helix domain-containing protein [Bacillota bacterium]